jgi:hypothetical protein
MLVSNTSTTSLMNGYGGVSSLTQKRQQHRATSASRSYSGVGIVRNSNSRPSLHQPLKGSMGYSRMNTNNNSSGLPPMGGSTSSNSNNNSSSNSFEPHTDNDQQRFAASHNPMSYYSNDYTDSTHHNNALKKQNMFKRTTSAPTHGVKVSSRGGIIPLSNKRNSRRSQSNNKFTKQRTANTGKNLLFANGAHMGGIQQHQQQHKTRKTGNNNIKQQYSHFRTANANSTSASAFLANSSAMDAMSTSNTVAGRPPSASILHEKTNLNNGGIAGGMTFEERQRVNNRRPNTAPTAPSPTKDETKDLKRENARLHQEMASMRDSFFRKMRGGKRFVSGGGFRTGGFPQHEQSDRKKNDSEKNLKSTIRALHAERKRLEEELSNAKLQIRRLNEQVRICQANTKKSDDEVKRLIEILKLKESDIENFKQNLSEIRKQAINFENQCKEQKDEIFQLKEALNAMENGQVSPIKIREVVPDPETLNELAAVKEELKAVKKEFGEALSHKKELKQALNNEKKMSERKDKKLDDLSKIKKVLEKQAKEMHKTIESQKAEVAEKDVQIIELNRWKTEYITIAEKKDNEIEKLKQQIKDLQREYDLHKQQSLGKHGSMQEALEKEIEKLKKQYADVTSMLEKEKCDRIKAQDGRKMAEDKCKDFRRELEAAKEAHNYTKEKLAAANKEIDSVRAELNDLQNQLKLLQKQLNSNDSKNLEWITKVEKYKQLIQKLKDEMSDVNRKLRNAESALSREKVQHDATKRDLKETIDEKKQLLIQIEDLKQQLNDANKVLSGMEDAIKKARREAKKEAMEKTLQSMVRLCVVAPTVNVHFNQQQTSCKAPMPSNRIKSIIQNEVLPNFTSLFLQMEEGVAQNGSRLDKWLEEMLAEMQTSIQAHLHDVFSGDSGNGGANTPSSRPSSRQQPRSRPSSRSGY